MKQVIQNTRDGKLALRDVPAPQVAPGHLLVRTRASLISAGTERMLVDFAKKSLAGKAKARPDLVKKVLDKARRDGIAATLRSVLARLDEPLPLGYSAAGEVVRLGAGLEGAFRVGQRVAMAGAGLANHAELNAVPRNLAAPIPDDVADDEACYGTLAAIALHAVRNLQAGLGDVVAVLGAGLLGQLAAQILTLAGARVLSLDYDAERLDLARRLGAEATVVLGQADAAAAARALTGGRGCDAVLIAAATQSSEPFHTAAAVARDRARVVMVGMTGTEFPYADFMKKELTVTVSRSYGPGRYDPDYEGRDVKYPEGWVRWTETENLAECLRLMSPSLPRRLDVAALTTHRFPLAAAEDAYAMITNGGERHMGVVLTYPDEAPAPERPVFAQAAAPAADRCVLGVIGAGNFARAVLLPELRRMAGVDLHTVVARRGPGAEQARQAFGFAQAATDAAAVLDNPAINAVLVATRHDSHAGLAARALAAGKAVLVEKPLAMDAAQLDAVVAARQESAAFFQVGFNRRFAPMAVQARAALAAGGGAKFVLLRVNAGRIDPTSWVQDAGEGGGRIVGEVCHFVDLARFLVGAPIVSVQADAAAAAEGPCDDVTATLRFADGSLATIAYTALGDTGHGKERVEGFAGGRVVTIDDFRRYADTGGGSSRGTQDKGFAQSLGAFVAAVRAGGPAPVDEAELIETSRATLAILDSLRDGVRVEI
ncbi:MAG: bi-domain-containing oxidoreductase [Hyphomicrobiales bacterium]|nr:bi-domain-containing oxidoreductase [Hyphomicrobiales bacterium]MCP5370123.1 bi-domain-containing oxidoreductase [Hyphomicrobiales bacterium]